MIIEVQSKLIEVDVTQTYKPDIYIIELTKSNALDSFAFSKDSTISRKAIFREFERSIVRKYVYCLINNRKIRFAVEAVESNGVITFGEVIEVELLERELLSLFELRIIAKRLALCSTCDNRTFARELNKCYYCTANWRYTRTIERVKVTRDSIIYRDTTPRSNASGRIIERPYSNIRKRVNNDFEYIRVIDSRDSEFFVEEKESYYLPGSNNRLSRKSWRGREVVVERRIIENSEGSKSM